MARRLLPLLTATLIAVIGLAGVVSGILLATTMAPPARTTGQVSGVDAPLIDTATGVLDLDGPRVDIRVAASGGPVFIGVARADDVTAYLGKVSRAEITRVQDDGRLAITRTGTEATLPDPGTADVWVATATGTGSASLTWRDAPGSWRLVVASNGSAAAPALTLDWTRAPRSNPAPLVIALGGLLLVGGLVALIVVRSRRRAVSEDDEEHEDHRDHGNDHRDHGNDEGVWDAGHRVAGHADPSGLTEPEPTWAGGWHDRVSRNADETTRLLRRRPTEQPPASGASWQPPASGEAWPASGEAWPPSGEAWPDSGAAAARRDPGGGTWHVPLSGDDGEAR